MTYAGDISPRQAWDVLSTDPDAVLVDCRTQAEWSYVGVPVVDEIGKSALFIEWVSFPDGARNNGFVDDLRAAGIRDDQQILFLCRSGNRSIGAAEAATAAGVGKASYNILEGFEGGLDADGHRGTTGWKALGLPWRQS
ncbi:rhodanese-like domain-containing protein [Williamsia sterculiae]|uniref:rhodanese-like domain-containing protein n=1 Tax=Williamsia sterculiae TaxID=1344003 RepID=UPI000970F2EC|nr:rhodanese-like domain-containing protein [Williamsia sterculiae]